jgi:hypothetical protein
MLERADRLILESSRRIVEAWPTGFSEAALRSHRWELCTARMEDALTAGDETEFQIALLLREAAALVLFAGDYVDHLEATDGSGLVDAGEGAVASMMAATEHAREARRILVGGR